MTQNTTEVRNSLGQKIEVGSHVVLVTQGQGRVGLKVGTVEKFSRRGRPQVRYLGGTMRPTIERYERLFVISPVEFKEHERRQSVIDQAREDFDVLNPEPDQDRMVTVSWHEADHGSVLRDQRQREWNAWFAAHNSWQKNRKQFVRGRLQAAGLDPYYEE